MMSRFMVPQWVKECDSEFNNFEQMSESRRASLWIQLNRFQETKPLVSIIIPAYNEEKNLLRTLASFAKMEIPYPTELIVVNNNSKDRTQEILDLYGIKSFLQPVPGISLARQMGLECAKGQYILNADADSIYPKGWAAAYVQQLQNPAVTCVYGRYSFIPSPGVGRVLLGMYEIIAESLFTLRRLKRDYLNVMGFSFAFRKEDALKVGGFNTSRPRWSDGWMAMQLMGLGKIELVSTPDARVWTSARRLMLDGGLGKAFQNRVRKEFSRLSEYVLPRKAVNH